MARPTDYTPELLEKAKNYLAVFRDAEEVIPTIAGLALHLGIRRETIHAWVKDPDKEEFSNTVGEILSWQEKELIHGGLSNKFNASITKLLLSSNHGHREKADVTTDGKQMPTPILGALKSDE